MQRNNPSPNTQVEGPEVTGRLLMLSLFEGGFPTCSFPPYPGTQLLSFLPRMVLVCISVVFRVGINLVQKNPLGKSHFFTVCLPSLDACPPFPFLH